MAMTLNLRADRELWKYIYFHFPFANSLHLSVLPDYNHVWAEQLFREDPVLHSEMLTPRHLRIIKSIERQAKMMGFKVNKAASRVSVDSMADINFTQPQS